MTDHRTTGGSPCPSCASLQARVEALTEGLRAVLRLWDGWILHESHPVVLARRLLEVETRPSKEPNLGGWQSPPVAEEIRTDRVIGKPWWHEPLVETGPPLVCYCGDLSWTVTHYGRITHKDACPVRTDPWCQAHPKGCPDTGADAPSEVPPPSRPSKDEAGGGE